MNVTDRKLKNFLNIHWLRPEKAIFLTMMSNSLEKIKFESPSLEVSCGDGINMFCHLGGELSHKFDVFKTTTSNSFTHTSYADVFDFYDNSYDPVIEKRPKIKIDYGLDWKKNLLEKSRKLDLYSNLVQHDLNVLPLPFESNFFKTIYSNSIYWIKDVDKVLTDVHRILHPDGYALMHVLTPHIYETLNKLTDVFSTTGIDILDRHRSKFATSQFGLREWKKVMKDAGFQITEIREVFPNDRIIDIWNIGLRPISHLLVQMSQNLSDEEKIKIKTEWVEIFYQLFKQLPHLKKNHKIENSPYLLFVLKK